MVTTVGVIGAGLMASQLAVLFAEKLQVPVVMADVDDNTVSAGLESVRAQLRSRVVKGRLDDASAAAIEARVTGTTDLRDFAEADWVIEAIVEDLAIKQSVLAQYEEVVGEDTVLATNTSSLHVAEIGARLRRPSRLVGFHFFNPVSRMDLIEVVRSPATDDTTVSTAVSVARALGKSPVVATDTVGFVVNRVLSRVMAAAWETANSGMAIEDVEAALVPLELPMTPFELLELVGPRVGIHVVRMHHDEYGDRFPLSDNLVSIQNLPTLFIRDDHRSRVAIRDEVRARFPAVPTGDPHPEVTVSIATALADEIDRMIAEGVVADSDDLDTAMRLGAGFPARGITRVLDDVLARS